MATEAIEERLKTIQDILRRPDPGDKSSQSGKTIDAKPVIEEDQTHRLMNEEDELSLGEMQNDLQEWWTVDEKSNFYQRLAGFKAAKGNRLLAEDVYEYWVAEWTRKIKEVSRSDK
jgi:hypothetical protein